MFFFQHLFFLEVQIFVINAIFVIIIGLLVAYLHALVLICRVDLSCILNLIVRSRVLPSAHLCQLIVNSGNIRIHLKGQKFRFILRHWHLHIVICIDLFIIHRNAVIVFIDDATFWLFTWRLYQSAISCCSLQVVIFIQQDGWFVVFCKWVFDTELIESRLNCYNLIGIVVIGGTLLLLDFFVRVDGRVVWELVVVVEHSKFNI